MKRSGPLKRKTPLRSKRPDNRKGARSGKSVVCQRSGCEVVTYVIPSRLPEHKYCSRACQVLAKHEQMLGTRRGAANPNYRHGKRVGVHQRDRRRFKSGQTTCQHQGCLRNSDAFVEHHVVYEQKVRREVGDPFDPRNALRVCWSCHSSHHNRARILSLTVLRDENYEFAAELLGAGAYDYLRRLYVGDDPRLDALLESPPRTSVLGED